MYINTQFLCLFGCYKHVATASPSYTYPKLSLFKFILLKFIKYFWGGFIGITINLDLKGARSRYFKQFQRGSNGHRINENIKITVQNYRRTLTKHSEARRDMYGQNWRGLKLIAFA